ncbi:hypothetical protein DMI62_06815 [Escherichia coli]|nr:hypothetical protein [Escherichia coli]
MTRRLLLAGDQNTVILPNRRGLPLKRLPAFRRYGGWVNQIGGKERYFFGNILWQTRALMDLTIGHKLAKGRPEREYLQDRRCGG